MVSHLLRFTGLGGIPPGTPRDPAQAPSPNPPRGAARDVLLHHHRLAELAHGEVAFLERLRVPHRGGDRVQTQGGRSQVGGETEIVDFIFVKR